MYEKVFDNVGVIIPGEIEKTEWILTKKKHEGLERLRAGLPVDRPMSKPQKLFCRRVPGHERAYTYRMGYQLAVGLYTGSDEWSRFTGSSLNRKNAKRKTNEATTPGIGEKVNGFNVGTDGLESAFPDQNVKPLNHGRISRSLRKRGGGLHVLSQRSKGKIRDKCTAFFRACGKKQRIFATLTFIQRVTDLEAVSILNKFLTALRKHFARLQYVWVAERQKNGNIHFHLIINRYLPIARYNGLWVEQQYNAGLRYGFITPEEIRSRVKDGTVQEILNPVHVKEVKSIYGLNWYLTKYITKQEIHPEWGEGFECAAWHCSRGVSRQFTSTCVSRSTFASTESEINIRVNRKTGQCWTPVIKNTAFYSVRWLVNKAYYLQFMREMETINGWVLSGMVPDKIPVLTWDYFREKYLSEN